MTFFIYFEFVIGIEIFLGQRKMIYFYLSIKYKMLTHHAFFLLLYLKNFKGHFIGTT